MLHCLPAYFQEPPRHCAIILSFAASSYAAVDSPDAWFDRRIFFTPLPSLDNFVFIESPVFTSCLRHLCFEFCCIICVCIAFTIERRLRDDAI